MSLKTRVTPQLYENVQLVPDNLRSPTRAGIILRTIDNDGKFYYLLGVDRGSNGELTDFGGNRENVSTEHGRSRYESAEETAFREFHEESLDIFHMSRYFRGVVMSQVIQSQVIIDAKMAIFIVDVEYSELLEAVREFRIKMRTEVDRIKEERRQSNARFNRRNMNRTIRGKRPNIEMPEMMGVKLVNDIQFSRLITTNDDRQILYRRVRAFLSRFFHRTMLLP